MVALPRAFSAEPAEPTETAPRLAPHADEVSSVLRVLGHSGRLMVLGHLRDGGKTVTQLQELIDAPQPVVSSHLARLRHEGLVRFERFGKCCVYHLADGPVRDLLDQLDRVFCGGFGPHLEPAPGGRGDS